MPVYKDIDGDSGVHSYEYDEDHITVWFKENSRSYTYSYSSAGPHHVEEMKRLADSGDGLHAYINYNVRDLYER